MKIAHIFLFFILVFAPQVIICEKYNKTDDTGIDHSSYCSSLYLNLEHKLNRAYNLMLDSNIDQAKRMYKDIESSLENNDLAPREKVCIANRVSKAYYDLFEEEKGVVFAQKYLDLAKESLEPDDFLLGKAYERLAALQMKTDLFTLSIENLTYAFDILSSYSHQFLIYEQLAIYYLDIDRNKKSSNYFKLAIDNFDQENRSIKNIMDQFFVYYGYIRASIENQDFDNAERCLRMMEKLSAEINHPYIRFIEDYKNAEYWVNRGNPVKALEYLNKELPDHPLVGKFKSGYYYYSAIANNGLGHFDKAIDYFQLSIDHKDVKDSKKHELGKIYLWMGSAYTHNEEPNKAIQAFENALCSFENNSGKFHTRIADTHNFIGRLHLKENRLATAKNSFIEALRWHTERTIGKMENVMDIALVHLGYFKEAKGENHIDSILHYMDINDKLLTQTRKEHRYFIDQGAVEYLANELYSENLAILEQLNNSMDDRNYMVDRMFRYIEGVKTYSFKRELKEQEGLHAFGVPDELIEQINLDKSEVKLLQDEIYKLKKEDSENETEFEIANLIEDKNAQLEIAIRKHNSTLLTIESNYSNYFNYKFNNSIASIEDVQNILDPNEAFIEYFSIDTSIFIIAIEDNDVHYINKPKSDNWEEIVDDYSDSVTKSEYQHQDSTSITYSKFVNSSHDLYNVILKDAIDLIDEEVTHLTIVPDEQLHFIQFDNLLTEKSESIEEYKDLEYLIHDYTISRSESASIYSTSKNKDRQHKKYKYIGFAPKYNNTNIAIVDSLESERKEKAEYLYDLATRGVYDDLPSARKSVNLITSMLSGISFIGNEASKQTFLERSHEGNIVHFAGHAVVDKEPKFSQLLFSNISIDSQLYASDIYEMDLDIDLVVLSACNTGNGKTKYGEGVMSLSRAFKFAGCSSMVMSLWNIPDVQTAEIDNYFFDHIQKGERIDDALRNSKLKFLNQATYQTAHPFYWSGLTASGSMKPIKTQNLWDRLLNLFM